MFTLSRRDFLAATAFLAVRADGAPGPPTFFRRTRLPIGLQLYTVGEDLDRDFHGTLAAVGKIGYRSVELAGLSGRAVDEWRQSLNRAHLKCPSMHVPPHATSGISLDAPGALAEAAHALGVGTIICPMFNLPEHLSPTPMPGEDSGTMLARLHGWSQSKFVGCNASPNLFAL